MADDPIKSFMVQLGFTGDAAGAKKVVDLANTTEAAITKAGEDGAADRVAAESNASNERVGIIKALAKIAVGLEQDRADRAAKIRKDEADKDEKLQQEREKKAKERREKALKEIQAQATRMATFALKAVGAIEATALGIVYATERAAKSFERLNYLSQRAGSSASKTTAVGYAFSQLGGQAADGEAAVSALGSRLRENPVGYSAALKSIGVEARKANGEMRDTADIVTDLGEALARIRKQSGQYGYAQAKARGAVFGLGEDQTQTLMDPRFRAMEAEGAAIDAKAGIDRDKTAAGGTAFEQSFRRLEQMADAIRTKISTNLFAALTPELDKLAKWASEHGEQIAGVVERIANDVIGLAKAVVDNLAKIDWDAILTGIERFATEFDKKSKEIFGENGLVIATLIAFGALVGVKVLGPLNLVLGVLTRIGALPLVARLLGGVAAGANLTTAALTVGAVSNAEMARRTGRAMTSGDPNAKFDPETGFVNDLDFGYGKGKDDAGAKGSGVWSWFKSKLGFGDTDPDARKVKDAIVSTAEGVKKLADKADGGSGISLGATMGRGGSAGMPSLRFGRGADGRYRRGGGGGNDSAFNPRAAEKPGMYRPEYKLSDADLDDYVVGTVAGEAVTSNPESVDAVINNMMNRLGTKGWGPSANLHDVASAPGQYAGHRRATAQEAERIRARIRAIASGGVPDNTNGSNSYRAAGYNGPWARKHAEDGRVVGGNRFAYEPGVPNGSYAPYREPHGASASQAGGSTFESVGEKIAGMKSAGLLTDEQCVTLAMAAVGVRKGSGEAGSNVHDWRKGVGADQGTLTPGTPVATFLNRDGSQSDRYAGGGAGTPGAHLDHAGVFQKYVLDAYGKRIGMTILEQYKGSRGAHLKDYLFGRGTGEGDGSNYHTVLGPDGRPLGSRAAMPLHVDVTDKSAERIGHGIAKGAGRAAFGHRNDHLAATQAVLRAHRGHVLGVDPHSMLGRHIRHSIDMSRRQVSMNNSPTFNIHGVTDTSAALADAHRLAGRGQADLVRNMSVMTA